MSDLQSIIDGLALRIEIDPKFMDEHFCILRFNDDPQEPGLRRDIIIAAINDVGAARGALDLSTDTEAVVSFNAPNLSVALAAYAAALQDVVQVELDYAEREARDDPQ